MKGFSANVFYIVSKYAVNGIDYNSISVYKSLEKISLLSRKVCSLKRFKKINSELEYVKYNVYSYKRIYILKIISHVNTVWQNVNLLKMNY